MDIPLSNATEEEYELILRLLEAKNAERMYQAFLQSDVYQTILGFSNDHMTDNSRMHYERFLESLDKRSTQAIIDIPSTIPYIASWILKRKEYFQLASFVFFIHKIYELHGFRTLPEDKEESWNYWTSRYHGSPEHLQEYHLKETLAKECPLFEWMLAFDWEQEVPIGSGTCDLVSETKDGRKIVVEVKRGNIRQGLGQIIRYRQEMKKRAEQPPTEVSGGTLYCTVLFFGPDGSLLGKHRKLKPTASERIVWGEGDGSTLPIIDTPFGKMGALICWENYMPLARTALYAKGVQLYIAPTADAREVWQSTIRHIALEGRCFVLSCNQYVTKEMYPTDLACYHELSSSPHEMCSGGSAIVGPLGDYIVQPVYGKEDILIADLDLSQIAYSRMDFNVVGHYARPDVFQLIVNEKKQQNAKFLV